jgi:dihydroorotate dehydrogenase
VPDWTYHPFFKPLLFRLGAENGRRLTLGILSVQAKTAVGRRIFRWFGHGPPPASLAVTAFGLRFPSPVGLGPGIDTDGAAVALMQHLGFGFVIVGPVADRPPENPRDTDPLRIEARFAIASTARGRVGAHDVARRLQRASGLSIPVGVALGSDATLATLEASATLADFFELPAARADDVAFLRAVRAGTNKPLLLRVSPDWQDDHLDRIVDRACEMRLDGCIATGGARFAPIAEGQIDGRFLTARSLWVTERIARRHGDALPILGAGGIFTPDDALAYLDAGARLVELHSGLVYAGPGLPGRIVHRLEHNEAPRPAQPPPSRGPAREAVWWRDGWPLLAATGWILIASGVFALGLAATVNLLPYDVRYLGASVSDLCGAGSCRIGSFMAHDRVSFGGSIIAIGILYVWLAISPVKAGQAWAWWAFLLSGVLGFASFLTYLGYGYFDLWHGRATVALLPVFVVGLGQSFRRLAGPRGPACLWKSTVPAWRWSPAAMGRACLTFSAMGMLLGGITIMGVGMTRVFVPQDLEYMRTTVGELRALNSRLVPLIAHDRAGFGGGLCSGGVAILCAIWCGLRPGARGLWWALCAAGVIGFGTAIGIHPLVGYTSFTHLLPAYAGAVAFVVGMHLLRKPVWFTDPSQARFDDI